MSTNVCLTHVISSQTWGYVQKGLTWKNFYIKYAAFIVLCKHLKMIVNKHVFILSPFWFDATPFWSYAFIWTSHSCSTFCLFSIWLIMQCTKGVSFSFHSQRKFVCLCFADSAFCKFQKLLSVCKMVSIAFFIAQWYSLQRLVLLHGRSRFLN